jgi:integrase
MAGSITKVGLKYRVTLDHGVDGTAKRVRKYLTASTEEEAKKLLTEFEYNQQRSIIVETTAYGYTNIINKHVVPYLGKFELQKIQPIHIQQYYKFLMDEKKLSPKLSTSIMLVFGRLWTID